MPGGYEDARGQLEPDPGRVATGWRSSMTDSKRRNTGPRRHLEHKARGVTSSSSSPSPPSPPPPSVGPHPRKGADMTSSSSSSSSSSAPSPPTPESPTRRLPRPAGPRAPSRPRAHGRSNGANSHNGRRAAAFDQPAYPRGVATSRPSSPAPARRPLRSPQRALFTPLCALGLGLFILLYMYMCQGIRSPSPVIQQHFEGPINAPVINYISADQQADVKAQVFR